MSFDISVAHLLDEEGGLVEHPKDPGGITKYGISLRAYPEFGRQGIINMTPDVAKHLAYVDYWTPSLCGILPHAVACIQLDTAFNMGVKSAIKILQRTLGMPDDGIAGKKTMAGINTLRKADSDAIILFIRKYTQNRMVEYRRRRNFDVFGAGWLKRTERVRDFSISMVEGK